MIEIRVLFLAITHLLKAGIKFETFDKPAENPILRADSFVGVAIAE